MGHAIYCAKSFIGKEPSAVLPGDDIVNSQTPCLKQMIEAYYKYKTSILGVQQVPQKDVSKYGIIAGKYIEDRIYKVKVLIEKPSAQEAPSNIAILGRYIITPQFFEILENTEPGKIVEIQLADALNIYYKKKLFMPMILKE